MGFKRLFRPALDWLEVRLGRRDPLVPPARFHGLVGDPAAFVATGEAFLGHFREVGGLKAHERVLEVGCGIGRMAGPLTRYLDARGSYDGFDVMRNAIRWCQNSITPRHPSFRFRHADILNPHYNPGGTLAPCEFRFPYDDGSFDFVFLTSVFTHMLPADVRHYHGEIQRVLRSGGRSFATFFLLNDDARARLAEPTTELARTFRFRHARDGYWINDPDVPEAAVAYDEAWVRALYGAGGDGGMVIVEPIHHGDWCGRPDALTGQDVVLARKR